MCHYSQPLNESQSQKHPTFVFLATPDVIFDQLFMIQFKILNFNLNYYCFCDLYISYSFIIN